MTREQAITKLALHLMQCGTLMPIEWIDKNGEGSDTMLAFNMAMEALREQAEREKGCEWCTGALPEDITPHREFFKNMLKGWSEDWLCVAKKVPSGEHILHCETDTALTDFSVDIPIRFCPMCGRELEVEP